MHIIFFKMVGVYFFWFKYIQKQNIPVIADAIGKIKKQFWFEPEK